MRRSIARVLCAAASLAATAAAGAATFFVSTGTPDGLMAVASRPAHDALIEIEAADDFIVSGQATVDHATFTGLIPSGALVSDVSQVVVEIYRVFPADSDSVRTITVPTRANSPSDVAFATRDSAAGELTFIAALVSPSFTTANSVLNGIHPSPNQKTLGEGPVTGQEVSFSIAFAKPIVLPEGHYFFVPQVVVGGGDFFWLSAPRPIVSPGTPFLPDLQGWIRNQSLAPDWLRVGTDIVGGAPAPTFNFCFSVSGVFAEAVPIALAVDPPPGVASDGNGVFDPGEKVSVRPSWENATAADLPLTGTATLGGPAGPAYTVVDGDAGYGTIAAGNVASCAATGNCYTLQVSAPAVRPATHWDATFTETPSSGDPPKAWVLHVGGSFADVARSEPFYAKIEALFHHGITSGCATNRYCPTVTVSRGQMAIFLAKALAGSGAAIPSSGVVNASAYDCAPGGISLFIDVAPTDAFCKHVHYLVVKNVTVGCSTTQFCPSVAVNRDAMAGFVARALVAPGGGSAVPIAYGPDPVTGLSYSCSLGGPQIVHFTDVGVADPFCKHVHYLWAKGIVGGCAATLYCPTANVARDAMAKFLDNAFDLKLYGP